ncbi:MAG: endolytic transglycosylase MltG [Clostridiaceae bacterium]|nr:endolytic transglycosylase MltG [Clostridiaceae bacterium]
MRLLASKSIILGLGIGIIITSLLGVIFFAGYEPQLSDAEIISLARERGMVDRYESSNDIKRNQDGSLLFIIHENESSTDVSKRLYDAGIIESSIEFEIIIKKEKLENAIKPGEYTISYSDDTKSIIEKITP